MTPSLAAQQSLRDLIERIEGLWSECGRLGLSRVDDTLPMPQTSATTFLPPQRGDLARPVAGLLNTIPDVLATLRAHADIIALLNATIARLDEAIEREGK